MLPIGKLFDIEKGALQSTKCTPGDYDFITAAEEWKTHNEYTHECEALIFAAAASGSLGRTHYVDGKFTTSDLCYILTPKNDEKYPLNLSFYHFVFNSLRPSLVAATKSGTSKESINQTNFKNYEIPYFDIELQDFWIDKLKNTLGLKDLLGSELANQQALLKKLRQQILQEAIEGKLTAGWRAQNPDVEPASELLKRIAVEKSQLVKEKKIKAQKPLPLITDEEKPFDLPIGWEWCRLGEILEIKSGKRIHAADYRSQGIPFLRSGEISSLGRGEPLKTELFIDEAQYREIESKFGIPKETDILIACIGGSIGNTWIVDDREFYFKDGNIVWMVSIPELNYRYLLSYLKTPYFRGHTILNATDSSYNALTIVKLNHAAIPLPPLNEQIAIVTKVEKLLALCDQLETQITQNQGHAEQLMQAVLKEAFSHNREAEPTARKSKTSADAPEIMHA
nr:MULTISPECIES: restriction endonuclease subunit S [unclassified Halomonas]